MYSALERSRIKTALQKAAISFLYIFQFTEQKNITLKILIKKPKLIFQHDFFI